MDAAPLILSTHFSVRNRFVRIPFLSADAFKMLAVPQIHRFHDLAALSAYHRFMSYTFVFTLAHHEKEQLCVISARRAQ